MFDVPADTDRSFLVGDSRDVPDRGRLIVEFEATKIGIFRFGDRLYGYENTCVHQGGPACQGLMVPRVREVLDADKAARGMAFDPETMHVVCPWHGFEYDIQTGAHVGHPKLRLKRYEVFEDCGKIYVNL